jgi:hypothetical protein
VRVAAQLVELPRTLAALESGDIPYWRAKGVARIGDQENEAELVALATGVSGGEWARMVAKIASRDEAAARARDAELAARRFCVISHDDHGWSIRARLGHAAGAAVASALDHAAMDAMSPEDPWAQRRADGLALMARSYLSDCGDRPGSVPEILVTVDLAALQDGDPAGGALGTAGRPGTGPAGTRRCAIDDAGPISVAEARRLACDARVIPVVLGTDGALLDVGRATRTIPPALKRAVRLRDGGCVAPGCEVTHPRWTEVHHIHHWTDGGSTALDNFATLCSNHHGTLHEGKWTLVPRRNRRIVIGRGPPLAEAA